MTDDFAGNFFPNPDNYPEPSFPDEVPAPASDPDAGALITVHYSEDWAKVLSAAVDQLLQYSTWEGDADAKRLAVQRANLLKSMLREDQFMPIRFNPVGCAFEQWNPQTQVYETIPGNEFIAPCMVAAGEDVYVNNTPTSGVENFRGRLDLYNVGTSNIFNLHRSDNTLVGKVSVPDGSLETRFQVAGSGTRWLFGSETPKRYFIIQNGAIGIGDTTPNLQSSGAMFQVFASGSQAPMSIKGGSSSVILNCLDDLGTLRAAMQKNGEIIGLGFSGYDYSSTSEWRRQWTMSGQWNVSTDSIRRGEWALALSYWNGDKVILWADWDPLYAEQPRLRVFDGEGSFPGDYGIRNDGTAFDKLVDQLRRYGLVDPDDFSVQQPEAALNLSEYEACNAAHFIAGQIAALVEYVYDNLSVISASEIATGLISVWDIPADFANQVLLSVQVNFIEGTDLLDDLSDVDTIAAQLIAANFEKDPFLAWVLSYGGFATQATVEVLAIVINASWASVVSNWIEIGRRLDAAACQQQYILPCEDSSYDFRWGSTHGWEVDEGYLELTEGIRDELNDGDWSVRMYAYFDSCYIHAVEIDYHCQGGTDQLLEIRGAVSDGQGGYDDYPLPYSHTMTLGYQTWRLELPPGGILFDRVLVRLVEWPSQRNNIIQQIRIEVE